MHTHRLFSALATALIPRAELVADAAFEPGALRWVAPYVSGDVELYASGLPLSEADATREQIGELWVNVMGELAHDELEDIDDQGRYAIRWNAAGDVVGVIVLYELRIDGVWTPVLDLMGWLASQGVVPYSEPEPEVGQ